MQCYLVKRRSSTFDLNSQGQVTGMKKQGGFIIAFSGVFSIGWVLVRFDGVLGVWD